MLGSGTLDTLLAKGYKYMFVSNCDNLGATMDLKLLTWFAAERRPLPWSARSAPTPTRRAATWPDDAPRQLLLRESAQCPDEDEKEFQNVDKYKFFNTNNLWVDLAALKAAMDKNERRAAPPGHQERQDRRPARQEVDQGAAARDGDGRRHRVL